MPSTYKVSERMGVITSAEVTGTGRVLAAAAVRAATESPAAGQKVYKPQQQL